MKQVDTDEIYRNIPLNKIPWNMVIPPDSLVQLIADRKIDPCKVIDFGCGAGNYAIYLASQGFKVTGIDISPVAIKLAKENAREMKIRCRFLVADMLGDLKKKVNKSFDFAYDWEVLHHIYPENRMKYIENVYKLLNPGGKYFSVCFSEEDPGFGGTGKYRETPLGTILYFSSKDELKNLFSARFNILDFKTIEISGKPVSHIANYAFMEKIPE